MDIILNIYTSLLGNRPLILRNCQWKTLKLVEDWSEGHWKKIWAQKWKHREVNNGSNGMVAKSGSETEEPLQPGSLISWYDQLDRLG